MPKINTVKRCNKDQGACGRCRTLIKKGDPYRWTKTRYGPKQRRCAAAGCYFRNSELTSSEKLGQLYGAQESAEDDLAQLNICSAEEAEKREKSTKKTKEAWYSPEEFKEALEGIRDELAEQVREVGEGYTESADNIRDHIPESSTADECEEKAGDLESWADDIEGVEFDDFDGEEDGDTLEERLEEWSTYQREKLEEVIGGCPL